MSGWGARRVGRVCAVGAGAGWLVLAMATACGNGSGQGGGGAGGGGGGRGATAAKNKGGPTGATADPHPVDVPARPIATVFSLEGDATVSDGPAVRHVREPLGGGASLRTGADGVAVIDLRDDARVTVFGDTVAELGRDGPATLVLARGAALAMLAPAGNSFRPPLRVATPEAIIDIGASGQVFVDVHSSGATWITVLSGDATVTRGERTEQGAMISRALAPARAMVVAGQLLDTVPGPATLASARAVPASLWRGRAPEADPAGRAADLVALDAALDAYAAQKARARELADQQRAAARISRTAAADVQREIVAQSGDLYRTRTAALMLWDRATARALAQGPTGAAEVTSRLARSEELLGRFVP